MAEFLLQERKSCRIKCYEVVRLN